MVKWKILLQYNLNFDILEMTRDVPTLPPILECTENHISRQIENEGKRHVKKFQILCIATNWLAAKGLLLQTDQIMIYL